MARRSRPGKVDRLPPELRDLIGDLRSRGSTIDEIMTKLRELDPDVDIGRTGLATYLQRWAKMRERLLHSRGAADAIMEQLGKDGGDDRVARMNIQMLHAGIMELQNGEDGEPVQLDPKSAMMVSAALRNLVMAKKADQESTMALRRELAREAAEALTKAEKSAAAGGSVDPAAVIRHIRETIYGVYE